MLINNQNQLKKNVSIEALKYLKKDMILGLGTGTTINYFIKEFCKYKNLIKGIVSSSLKTTYLLKKNNFKNIYNFNQVNEIDLYLDSADEINKNLEMIKGGGGALTKEKILANYSNFFICIVDVSKYVKNLGNFPLPIEILPESYIYVTKELIKINKNLSFSLRKNFVTEYGNNILDVKNFNFKNPKILEKKLNNITGIVSSGIFSQVKPNILLISTNNNIKVIKKK